MFVDEDFEVFNESTLPGRMAKIRTIIDPKFEAFAHAALPLLPSDETPWTAHVAKHLRRTVYPPDNTWVALAQNKRGYKMLPHFELGIWDDNLYLFLAVLENLKEKPAERADWQRRLEAVRDDVLKLPADFVLSPDHMVNSVLPLTAENVDELILEFGAKKHPEFLVGLQIKRGDARIGTPQLQAYLLAALSVMVPIYEKLR